MLPLVAWTIDQACTQAMGPVIIQIVNGRFKLYIPLNGITENWVPYAFPSVVSLPTVWKLCAAWWLFLLRVGKLRFRKPRVLCSQELSEGFDVVGVLGLYLEGG